MPIYMKYEGIDGSVATDTFVKWIECTSFQLAIGRAIGTAARGAITREHSEPHISEITVTKMMDQASPKLFVESVAGLLNKKVTLKFTTTTSGKVDTYLTYELENVGISSYSKSSGGDDPSEAISLNFTKIMYTFKGMGPDVQGNPETVGYDLTKMAKI